MNQYINSKYDNKSFEEKVKISNDFVSVVAKYFIKKQYLVLSGDNIYHHHQKKIVYSTDLLIMKNMQSFFIDCKDYSKLLSYNATGISESQLKKYEFIQQTSGIPVLLFWRDNINYFNNSTRISKPHILKNSSNNELIFAPYGEFLNNLVELDFNIFSENGIKKEVMFSTSRMKYLHKMF